MSASPESLTSDLLRGTSPEQFGLLNRIGQFGREIE